MPASSLRLDDLIPHRDAMRLIDEVVAFDADKGEISAAFTATPAWCGNWAAIEYMAQTAAAAAGAVDRMEGWEGPPRPGFLLGSRKLELYIDRFESGRRYLATARNTFRDSDAASFDCEISDGERVVARATLNAYRPPDAGRFLAEQDGRPASRTDGR